MQAVKKTASIHKLRRIEAKAADSGRTIVTTYYVDNGKALITKVNRAKNADRAVQFATGHMRNNDYDALYCEVWDEMLNEVITVLSRDFTGALSVMDYYDTATGKKVREQPWKKKLQRLFPNVFVRENDGTERNLSLDEFRNIFAALQPKP